jgi:hypothetical protein
MRPGKEPHGAPQHVHVDKAARKAIIKEKAGAMPDEADIVEENCRPEKKLAAVRMQDKTQHPKARSTGGSKQPGRENACHGQGSTPANDAATRPRIPTTSRWFR